LSLLTKEKEKDQGGSPTCECTTGRCTHTHAYTHKHTRIHT
jgi:hypothetical protein